MGSEERWKGSVGPIDSARSEEALHIMTEERNILYTVKGRMAKWIGCIFCGGTLKSRTERPEFK